MSKPDYKIISEADLRAYVMQNPMKVPFNYLREVEPKFLYCILTCRNRLFPTIIRLSTERFAN